MAIIKVGNMWLRDARVGRDPGDAGAAATLVLGDPLDLGDAAGAFAAALEMAGIAYTIEETAPESVCNPPVTP